MSADSAWLAALADRQTQLWVLAVLLYGVGDSVTTVIGLQSEDVTEGGPLALLAIEQAGVGGFLLFKLAFLGICCVTWYLLRTPGRLAIPLALALVGGVVTVWNALVLL
ncbi:DUF5658 family protein [Halovenus marina]|uniref:DUF5658 family protein n=1 Tax=Halovenus marina TaxID=3396621 RepID=UPI003F54F6AC